MAASAPFVAGADPVGPAVDLRLTSLGYGDDVILGPMELQVPRGQTLALVGPSGVGKSTLLRVFAGLHQDYRGTCRVEGHSSIVFQEPALLPWRDLVTNITATTNVSRTVALRALDEVGLVARAQDFPGQLSLGQQRRLALARAFAPHPDLLLLDEPFVSLDPALVADMMQLFLDLRAAYQITTVLVTHVKAEAEHLADRVVTLGGKPAVIQTDNSVTPPNALPA